MRKLIRFFFSLLKLAVLLVLGVAAFAFWQELSRRPPPPAVVQPSPPLPPPAGGYPAAPQALPVVDLVVVGARGTWQQGQRYFEVGVQNRGPGLAPVVHADCSYRCSSSGVAVHRAALFRNAQLAPGQSFNGVLPVTPCADAGFQLSCLVYSGTRVQEGDTANNQWTGWVQFR